MQIARVLPTEPFTTIDAYRDAGGGQGIEAARGVEPDALFGVVADSGLRGRGGAGFPTGRKWQTVRDNASPSAPTTVVVNAAEGEPGTYKDRAILRANPYAVIEGAAIAAVAIGSSAIVFGMKERFTDERVRLEAALAEARAAGWLDGVDVAITHGPARYLLGEETALLEVIDGRPPFPRVAPPYRRGVIDVSNDAVEARDSGLPGELELTGTGVTPPALVDNVETLANVAGIVANGAAWFRSVGTAQSPGTIVCTVSGAVQRPGVGEVAMGTTLREAIDEIAGGALAGRTIVAVQPGVSAAPVPAAALDTPLTYEDMAAMGSGLGSASLIVLDDSDDMVAVAAGASRFLFVESCGQCTPCKRDGGDIAATLARIASNTGDDRDIGVLGTRLDRVAEGARCALARQHEDVVRGYLRVFTDDFARHLEGSVPAAAPTLFGPIIAFDDEGDVVVDADLETRRPDWTANGSPYQPGEQYASPAERLDQPDALGLID